jgi:ketosteroid isomerase-like protein
MVRNSDTDRSAVASRRSVAERAAGLDAHDVAAIREQQERWLAAERSADWQAIAAMCTEDTVWAPPSQPEVHGRAALLHWGLHLPSAPGQLSEVVEEIGGAGRSAYVRGFYVVDARGADGSRKRVAQGTFLRLLRRRSDAWRVSFDIWTEDSLESRKSDTRAD